MPYFQGAQALKQLRGVCWCVKHMQDTAPFVGVDPAQCLPRRVLHGHMFTASTRIQATIGLGGVSWPASALCLRRIFRTGKHWGWGARVDPALCLPRSVGTEAGRVCFMHAALQAAHMRAGLRLSARRLYAADASAVPELARLAAVLLRAPRATAGADTVRSARCHLVSPSQAQ